MLGMQVEIASALSIRFAEIAKRGTFARRVIKVKRAEMIPVGRNMIENQNQVRILLKYAIAGSITAPC